MATIENNLSVCRTAWQGDGDEQVPMIETNRNKVIPAGKHLFKVSN